MQSVQAVRGPLAAAAPSTDSVALQALPVLHVPDEREPLHSAGSDWRARSAYSGTVEPLPPISAGTSFIFGRPSRIGSFVSW